MNVFDKYSIEEISKRTKISPISLKCIKNKEYGKIPKIKFIGFIRIIEREFGVNLDEIIEEYNEFLKNNKLPEQESKVIKEFNNNNLFFIFGAILLIIAGILLYKNSQPKPATNNNLIIETNQTNVEFYNDSLENNVCEKNETNESNFSNTIIINEINESNETNKTNAQIPEKNISITSVTIIPKKLLWYKITNLDTNNTREFLTSTPKTFQGKNFYIKLGHGEEIIEYGDKNITPNTRKIVKLLLQDGNVTYIKGRR